MRQFALALAAGAALSFGLSQASIAADMPVKAPVKAAAAVAPFSWTGCYVGVQAGYAKGDTGYDLNIPPTPNSGTDFDLRGGVAGGHVGCNYQISSIVLGVEGDFEWTGIDGDDGGFGGTVDRIDGKWQGSLRGRVGVAFGQMLLYGTGGWARMKVEYSRPSLNTEVLDDTLSGWTAGAGLEFAFAPNWTARIEYRYAEFDSEGFPFVTGSQRTLRETQINTIRVGASFKF